MSKRYHNRGISVNSFETEKTKHARGAYRNRNNKEMRRNLSVESTKVCDSLSFHEWNRESENSRNIVPPRTGKFPTGSHPEIFASKKDELSLQNEYTVTWEDVSVDGDWSDIYPGVELLAIEEVSKILGRSVDEINNLVQNGDLLALGQGGKREIRFPAEQFDDDMRPVEGLAEILTVFDSHDFAWRYLSTPLQLDNGTMKPINVLKSKNFDKLEVVLSSAACFGSEFT